MRTDYGDVIWHYGERQQYRYILNPLGLSFRCYPFRNEDVNITCTFDYSGAYYTILTNLTYIGPLNVGVLQTAIEERSFGTRLTLPTKTIKGKS